MLAIFVTVAFFLVTTALAVTGGVKVNKQPMEPLPAIFVAPVLIFLIGCIFLAVGALFTLPVWIWLI